MTFNVEFSDEAERNVREIRDWIAWRSRDGAWRWLEALEQATSQLGSSADSFALAPESDVFDAELHQILFATRRGNTYRALYVIRESTVHIVSVRGAGQQPIQAGELDLPE